MESLPISKAEAGFRIEGYPDAIGLVPLHSREAKRLAHLALHRKDLEFALACLMGINDVKDTTYDLILTHAPNGEYSTHRRHEEVSKAVIDLWLAGIIRSKELLLFAYQDNHGQDLPKPIETAHRYETYPEAVRQEKYRILTQVYGVWSLGPGYFSKFFQVKQLISVEYLG